MLQTFIELGPGMKLGHFGYKLKADNTVLGPLLCMIYYCHGVSSFLHHVPQDGILTGHHVPKGNGIY